MIATAAIILKSSSDNLQLKGRGEKTKHTHPYLTHLCTFIFGAKDSASELEKERESVCVCVCVCVCVREREGERAEKEKMYIRCGLSSGAGNPCRKGRIGTIGLLFKTGCFDH